MIELYNDFFSEEEYDFLHKRASNIVMDKMQEFRVNMLTWDPRLVDPTASPILHKDILENTDEWNIVTRTMKEKLGTQDKIFMSFHFGMPGSCILWHNDPNKFAITIYLNKEWDPNDGGYFIYEDDKILKSIPPQGNLAVVQKQNVQHRTSKTSLGAPIRMSIQIFREYDVDI